MMLGAGPNLTPFPNSIILRDGHCHNHGRLPARDAIYLAPTPSRSRRFASDSLLEGEDSNAQSPVAKGCFRFGEGEAGRVAETKEPVPRRWYLSGTEGSNPAPSFRVRGLRRRPGK